MGQDFDIGLLQAGPSIEIMVYEGRYRIIKSGVNIEFRSLPQSSDEPHKQLRAVVKSLDCAVATNPRSRSLRLLPLITSEMPCKLDRWHWCSLGYVSAPFTVFVALVVGREGASTIVSY